MQLDRSRISIRERSWADNLDLALQIIRANAGGVFRAALMGILPMLLINWALLESRMAGSLSDPADTDVMVFSTLLVMLEAPVATAMLTLYLGQTVFLERPDWRQIVRDFLSCLPQLILFQGFLRLILFLPGITCFIFYGVYPFLNEVILLERNPLIARNGQISTLKRNKLLHRGSQPELFSRAIGTGILALLLITALWASHSWILENVLGMQAGHTAQMLAFQCILWFVACYFTVARFLCYLDLRIRGEGWEVELILRAERERLMRQSA